MKQLPSWLPLSEVLKHIPTTSWQSAELNLQTCCVATGSKQQSAFSILPSRTGYGDMDTVQISSAPPK